MTCVLQSPWQFSQFHGWSSMDSASPVPIPPENISTQQHGRAASESESTQGSNDSNKKRMSRAGTRSVSTLSTAQLERKRANDRDAQRAIRQRTKEHIDSLERTIKDLRVTQEATEKLLAATQQQNRDVLAENAYLRSKLGEAGVPIMLPENADRLQHVDPPVQPSAPVHPLPISGPLHEPTPSTPRSVVSLANGPVAEPETAYWLPPQLHSVQSAPANLQTPTPLRIMPYLANWRPQGGQEAVDPSSANFPNNAQSQSYPSYHTETGHASNAWPIETQNQMLLAQRMEQPHAQVASSNYIAQPPLPPQTSNQPVMYGKVAASPGVYPNPEQSAFGQPVQYMASPAQISPVVMKHEAGTQPPRPSVQQAAPHDTAYGRSEHSQPANQQVPLYSVPTNQAMLSYPPATGQPMPVYNQSTDQPPLSYNQPSNQPVPPYAGPLSHTYPPHHYTDG